MRKASELPPTQREATKDATGDVQFGENLVRLRRRFGLSQEQVAAELGISRPSLVAYEAGGTLPMLRTAARLAAFYEVTLNELAGHLVDNA